MFVDGLGIGLFSDDNPCSRALRLFRHFQGETFPKSVEGGYALGLDATLGIEGLPQSATGQTALLTGVNAAALIRRHLNGFPNAALRQVIFERSILKMIAERNLRAAFLNTFRPPFFDYNPMEIVSHLSATSLANLAAGLPFFNLQDIAAGRSVYQDITGETLREKGFDVPLLTPAEAGAIIGNASQSYNFSLFEYFQTDKAGHAQDRDHAVRILRRLEEFVESVLAEADLRRTLIILTSDHGNIEDLSRRGHTRNPAMTLLFGVGAEKAVRQLRSILDVYPLILSIFPERQQAETCISPA